MPKETSRDQTVELTVTAIERQFGKGSIMRLGEGETLIGDIPVIKTGSIGLDVALGIGGLPRGRVVEVYGPESSGKPHWPFMPLPKLRRLAVSLHLLMPSMHLM